MNRRSVTFSRFAWVFSVLITTASAPPADTHEICETPGWFPSEYGVKDHTVFHYDGFTYIAAIQLPEETRFAYARSVGFCDWVELEPILAERTDGAWDENRIWAPFVFEEAGVWYLYYTGVNDHFAQSIMLATSADPSDPGSWVLQGMIFQPTHPGTVWSPTAWSNNRDPMVTRSGDTYYLYYTGRDVNGGIVGLATAPSPEGPWIDHGATHGPVDGRLFESPTLFQNFNTAYLLFHSTFTGKSFGAEVRSGSAVSGPWSQATVFFPGWAHEIWRTPNGDWYASYLKDYSITIAPLAWDMTAAPPAPFIDVPIYRTYTPFVANQP